MLAVGIAATNSTAANMTPLWNEDNDKTSVKTVMTSKVMLAMTS
jgi:hypothetical protein